jgi:Stress responsive A/B Barrel Domain
MRARSRKVRRNRGATNPPVHRRATGHGRTNRKTADRSHREVSGLHASAETTNRIRNEMVSHLVLMKARPDLSPPERQMLIGAFERAIREIPTVKNVRVGRRITHGAGYELTAPDAADYLVVIEFDNLAGLAEYLRHPEHQELGARFNQSLSSAWVYDFEVSGPEGLRSLL